MPAQRDTFVSLQNYNNLSRYGCLLQATACMLRGYVA
jgi:hypothetical protein